MSTESRLLFVYNADSGLFNTLGDIGHKLFSPSTYPCRLCAITHGYLAERAEWRAFLDSLGVGCEFLHRDQFRERFPGTAITLPAVFCYTDGQPRVCVDATALSACGGFKELEALLRGSWLPLSPGLLGT